MEKDHGLFRNTNPSFRARSARYETPGGSVRRAHGQRHAPGEPTNALAECSFAERARLLQGRCGSVIAIGRRPPPRHSRGGGNPEIGRQRFGQRLGKVPLP